MPLANILLGEVIFGGVGAGLYGMLVMVLLSVFIAGLMVGRTPEYLGKKIEAREMKAAMLYVLIFPLIILGFAAWAAVAGYGTAASTTPGRTACRRSCTPSRAAPATTARRSPGLNANTPFYNVTLGLAMLAGRFLMIVPVMAIAGLDGRARRPSPPGPGPSPPTARCSRACSWR